MRRWPLLLIVLAILSGVVSAQTFNDPVSFMTAFSAAVKKDDFALLNQLVRDNKKLVWDAFLYYEVEWCVQSTKEGDKDKEVAETMSMVAEQLATMHRVANKDGTLVARWRWLRSLTPEQKKARIESRKAILKGDPLYRAASKSRTEAAVKEAIPHFKLAMEEAAKATDVYGEALACFYLADLYEIATQFYEACYYARKAELLGRNAGHATEAINKWRLDVKIRNLADKGRLKPDLIDTELPLAESLAAYKKKLEEGVAVAGAENGGGGAGGKASGKAARSAVSGMPPPPTNHSGSMEWVETKDFKIKKQKEGANFFSTYFLSNGDWQNWVAVQVKKGEKTRFPFLPGDVEIENDSGKLFLLRKDGKKTKRERLKVKVKPKVQTFKNVVYRDGTKRTLYMLLMVRPSTFKVMGYDLRDSGEIKTLLAKGASTLRGKLRGEDFAIHDSNANGSFNDWGIDTVIIGKGKRARIEPLSKYVVLKGLMYEMKVDASGRVIRTKPWDGDMAPLKVEFKAGMPVKALVASGTSADATYFINLLEATKRPIWVVPGRMRFVHGYLASGKGLKAKTIHITRGRSGTFPVEVGRMNIWKLGGAGDGFTFQFKTETRRDKGQEYVIVPGKEIKVLGAFGEEYSRFYPGHVLPAVSFRKGKDGPIWLSKREMRRPERADYENDMAAIYFPRNLKVKKTVPGAYSVKMECDYQPLGHIESKWITGE